MKLPKFSPQEQRALAAILLVSGAGLYIYVALLMGPLWHKAVDLGQQVRTAREELQQLQAATANEAAIREQYQSLQKSVGSLRRFLPAEKELPAVIEALSDMARQTNMKIQTIFPQRSLSDQAAAAPGKKTAAIPEPVVYRQVPIQIDAQAGYHQLGAFLSLVEAESRPMELRSLRIAADPREPKRHTIKMVIDAYFAADGATPQPL